MVCYALKGASHTSFFQIMLMTIMCLSLVSTVISGYREMQFTQPKVNPKSNVQFIKTNTTIYKLLLDNSTILRDTLIVGARNYLLRVNSSLSITDIVKNGPHDNSVSCQSYPSADTGTNLQNNDNRVLILQGGKLIVCGTVSNGMCHIVDVMDICN